MGRTVTGRRASQGQQTRFGSHHAAGDRQRQEKRVKRTWFSGLYPGKEPTRPEAGGLLGNAFQTLPEFHAAVRNAAAKEILMRGEPPLRKIRARRPFWGGRSLVLHPLKARAFWRKHFGRHSLLLRRGPLHPGLPGHAGMVSVLTRSAIGVTAEVVPGTGARGALGSAKLQRAGRGPEHGAPVAAALLRGNTVRLDHLERRSPHLVPYAGDPFWDMLARLAPGRPLTSSLYWAPSGSMSMQQQEVWYEQFVMQAHGARRWVVCAPGVVSPPPPTLAPEKLPTHCRHAMLRRGDMLYIPARTWHWSLPFAGPSGHLITSIMPLVALDFLQAAGGGLKDRMTSAQAVLGRPLPLWKYRRIEDAAKEVSAICLRLPWEDPEKDSAICTPATVKFALQRLSGKVHRQRQPLPETPRTVRSPDANRADDDEAGAERSRQPPTTPSRGRRQRQRLVTDLWHIAFVGILIFCTFVFAVYHCCASDLRDPRAMGGNPALKKQN